MTRSIETTVRFPQGCRLVSATIGMDDIYLMFGDGMRSISLQEFDALATELAKHRNIQALVGEIDTVTALQSIPVVALPSANRVA